MELLKHISTPSEIKKKALEEFRAWLNRFFSFAV